MGDGLEKTGCSVEALLIISFLYNGVITHTMNSQKLSKLRSRLSEAFFFQQRIIGVGQMVWWTILFLFSPWIFSALTVTTKNGLTNCIKRREVSVQEEDTGTFNVHVH